MSRRSASKLCAPPTAPFSTVRDQRRWDEDRSIRGFGRGKAITTKRQSLDAEGAPLVHLKHARQDEGDDRGRTVDLPDSSRKTHMDSQYAYGDTLACSPRGVTTLTPTVVSIPSSRNRRPSAIESLTEPPLESSTMVAPPSCRPRANSSKSLGLSLVTMPTALTQPWQFGWQATQLNLHRQFAFFEGDAGTCRTAQHGRQRDAQGAPLSGIQPLISA